MLNQIKSALFGPVLAVVGIALLFAGHNEASVTASMKDHGKNVQATVTEVEWKEKAGNDSRYSATIVFKTEGGQEVTTKTSISKEFGQQLRNDKAEPVMSVRYLPESPTTVQDEGHEDSSGFMYTVGGVLLLAGIGVTGFRFMRGRKANTADATA